MRAWPLVVAVVGALATAFAVTSVDCSSPATADGGAGDAGGDSPRDVAGDISSDAGMSCTTPNPADEPPAAYWLTPDWQRLGGPVACCAAAIATNPVQDLPALAWIPCLNGATDCLEDKVTWDGGTYYNFGYTSVSRDGSGAPKLLKFTRAQFEGQDYGYLEDDVYDFGSGIPVAGLREGYGGTSDVCTFVLNVGGATIGVLASTKPSDPHDYVAWGAAPLTTPAFLPLSGPLEQLFTKKPPAVDQDHRMSATSLGFELVYGGTGLVRMPVGAASYVMSKAFGTDNTDVDVVEGDDVFAGKFYGSAGWSQEYVMAADGTVSLFRGKDKTHVTTLRSDGKTLFWVESYGLSDPHIAPGDFIPQPNMEVWSAPYTNDPATLAASAKKLATIQNHTRPGHAAVAFRDHYAFETDEKTLTVVRSFDGAVQQISAGPGRRFDDDVAYVSPSEVWVTMDNYDDVNMTPRQRGIALARYTLREW